VALLPAKTADQRPKVWLIARQDGRSKAKSPAVLPAKMADQRPKNDVASIMALVLGKSDLYKRALLINLN
jgi:hypothetical protein